MTGTPSCCVEEHPASTTIEANRRHRGLRGDWQLASWLLPRVPAPSGPNGAKATSQSWAVLSNAGDPIRARQAMAAVDQRLVRRDQKIIQLLDPPFDQSDLEPGYIKGYMPGVRASGGQYTHAAIWTTMAFAMLGDTQRAWEYFALLNPVHHGSTPEAIERYKVEPYVMCADVYGVSPHTGRGGWTWYTGAAGWMYRLTWKPSWACNWRWTSCALCRVSRYIGKRLPAFPFRPPDAT